MISIVPVQDIGDARGVKRDIFSLSRGFSTALASSGEGLGRELTHEDIKKENRAKTAEKLPNSIDEIVLPFFAPKGNKLERVAGESAFYTSMPVVKGQAPPFAGQNRAYYWAAHTPSAALDVRTAPLPYARTKGDYSSSHIQEYDATAYAKSAETGTFIAYARAGIAPTVLVPPILSDARVYAKEKQLMNASTSPLQSHSDAYIMHSAPVPQIMPSQVKVYAFENQNVYAKVQPNLVNAPIALPLPKQSAAYVPIQLHPHHIETPQAKLAPLSQNEAKAPIEQIVRSGAGRVVLIAKNQKSHRPEQTATYAQPLQQRIGIVAYPTPVQQHDRLLSPVPAIPIAKQQFSNVYPASPQPPYVPTRYPSKTAGTNKQSGMPLAREYVLPFITALGLSAMHSLSFSYDQRTVQQQPITKTPRQAALSSLIEPYLLTTAKQPQSLEKIKRELPTYDRVAAPAALEARASEIEAKYGCVVSFKVISVADGHTWGRKDTSIIPPASVSKLGLVYAAMMLAQDGQLDLEQRIDIKQLIEQNPRLLPKNVGEQVQDRYTLREMLEEIVKDKQRGSNLLANVLLSMIGKDKANELLRKGGFKHTSFASDAPYTPKGDYHNNATTLEEAARLMDILGDAKYWKPQYQEALGEILQASKNWMPFLFGPNSKDGKITLRNVKHGQTENAMSVVYDAIGSDGRKYVGIISMTNLPGRLVEENYRKATEMGKQAVNDFTQLSRLVYSHLESVQGASFK